VSPVCGGFVFCFGWGFFLSATRKRKFFFKRFCFFLKGGARIVNEGGGGIVRSYGDYIFINKK